MELDHLFMFVRSDGPEIELLAQTGFVETYRRVHPGQGTANVCYCFDNLYLELLWVQDLDEVRSAPIGRTKLYERSRWRDDGTCPFGIAWRGDDPPFIEPTWPFRPPYLPTGVSIAVASDNDDPNQPMMFRSPGAAAPLDWPAERRGNLQRSSGFGAVTSVRLDLPEAEPGGAALHWLEQHTDLDLGQSDTGHGLALMIEKADGGTATLSLPSIDLN